MMTCSDVVFIVPGFLSFSRTENFGHFGERLCSALRIGLESKLGRAVPVIAIPSLPTGSLASRQRALLRAISTHLLELGGADRLHLFGHGPGGVDGYFLTCREPLEGTSWAQAGDTADVRARIRSLTTLASPHLGSSLAAAKGTGAFTFAALKDNREGAAEAAKILRNVVASAWHQVEREDVWFGLFREGRKISHVFRELMRWQELFADAFTPTAMESLRHRSPPVPNVQRRSFVTLTPRPDDRSREDADVMFADLYKRTSARAGWEPQHANIQAAMDAVRSALSDPQKLIISPHAKKPSHVDAGSNDGVVNASRQLMNPYDPQELAAVVVGDHFDVIGDYKRFSLRSSRPGQSQREMLSGVLNSGSHFRDDEFFALYRRVAEVVSESIQPQVSEPVVVEESVGEPAPAKKKRRNARREATPES